MAILPVSSVKLDSNSRLNFTGDKEVSPRENHYKGASVGKYATVPVVVLMTLNPSLSAQAAGSNAPEPKQITMEMPYAAPTHSQSAEPMYDFATEAAALAEAPESAPQTNAIKGSKAWYNTKKVVESFPFVSDGKKYSMQYMTSNTNNKEITTVYFIPDGYDKYSEDNIEPPMFEKLILHNLGNDNDSFAGAWTVETAVVDGSMSLVYKEIKLPDDIADKLIDMLYGDYKMPPNKYLKEDCVKNVYDSSLLPTEIYEDY